MWTEKAMSEEMPEAERCEMAKKKPAANRDSLMGGWGNAEKKNAEEMQQKSKSVRHFV